MLVDLRFLLAGLFLWGATGIAHAEEPAGAGAEFFEQKIRPVLAEQCYQCHSAEAQKSQKLKAGLLLDTPEGFVKGGESGPVVVPGKARESLLILAIRHEDLRMPPKSKLPDAVIADFEAWVNRGAVFPAAVDVKPQAKVVDWDKARQFWAFQAPARHPLPQVQDPGWPQQDIDFFVLAELERRGLRPVQSASKRDLIRRTTFDVIGLPPTPAEVAAFVQDDSPEAFARVVDRLLSSPHYGERWGRYWLDVARYAEDKALAIAKPSPHAFRYRDWVVQALNADMPYDQFLRLQLAGDLLPEPITDYFQRLAGLGFQGLGAEYHKGNFAAQVMADELDDRVDTLTRGLLGLTVACARCHDHKYDPIPTRDYYSLAAAYQGSNLSDLPLATPAVVERYAAWDRELKSQEAGLAEWVKERGRAIGRAALPDVGRYVQTAFRIRALKTHKVPYDEPSIAREEQLQPTILKRFVAFCESGESAKVAEFVALRTAAEAALAGAVPVETKVAVPDDVRKLSDEFQSAVRAALDARDKLEQEYQAALAAAEPKDKGQVKKAPLDPKHEALLKVLWLDGGKPFFVDPKQTLELLAAADREVHQAKLAALETHRQTNPGAPDMIHGVSGGGQAMRVHHRGRVDNLGDNAPPGFLQVVSLPAAGDAPPRFNRLDLANAIATPTNPLTARVFVNRVWQHHFGRGIVATPSNFGLTGDRPTHPELLDDLAVRFIESGWSIKWLHRTLLLSATYQLSTTNDPANAARDPENQALWRMAPRRLDVEAWRDAVLAVSGRLQPTLGGPSVELNKGDNVRRTIYATVSRSVLDATLNTFDFPDANVSSDRRSVTTIPQQQLFALNSGFVVDAAKVLALRLQAAAATDDERVALAFEWTYGRPVSAVEKQLGLTFLRAAAEQPSGDKLTPWEQYAQALLAANEFIWVD